MSHRGIVRAFAVLLCALGLCSCAATNVPPSSLGVEAVVAPRIAINLNSQWKFIRQDVDGAQQVNFDDSGWQSITLPHTWNNLDGEDGGDNYYRGPGWYRRRLDLAGGSSLAGKSCFLKFDGASSVASVYVNGRLAGTHRGMFAAFCYDVTPLLNLSGDNVIAVRVTNAKDQDLPPLSADFTFFGGIYRGVELLALNPLSISPVDDAGPGVYIMQQSVDAAHAALQITTKLRNCGSVDQTAAVTSELLDAADHVLQSTSVQTPVSADRDTDAVQSMNVDHPHLWDARKDPYLYHVRVTVAQAGGRVVDRVIQPLGIRFFHADPEKGFFLNGRSYPLHGVNRHQDRLDMGWAISSSEQREDFGLIMEMGCTAIRLAHYQHAQEFYDLCDRGGLIVWAEACMVNSVTPSQAFDAAAKEQLRELIKQSYNHPSICFWALFNELRDTRSRESRSEAGKTEIQHQLDLVTQLNQLAHQLDPTRLTTGATNVSRPANPLNQITDVIAYNRYDGWYVKTVADWPQELDSVRSQLPAGRALAISEYGAGASIYQHEINPKPPRPGGLWHPEEWQGVVHEAAYKAMKDRPYLWGTFLWNMFDFASDYRNEGDHQGRNDKGLVTYDRKTKKDAFYFYKANWSDDPVIYITDRRFTPRNIKDCPIKVYSNCDSVEVKFNGQSLGAKTGDDSVFAWPDVTLTRGKNVIEASGTRRGAMYTDSITIDYDPGVIAMRPSEPSTRP
jgi:beta-galactosidase